MRDRASSHSNFVFGYSNVVCEKERVREKAFASFTTEQYLNEAKVSFELFFFSCVVSKVDKRHTFASYSKARCLSMHFWVSSILI